VLQTATATSGTHPATTGAGTATLHIGSNIGVNNFVTGPVSEVIIYNRALSSDEVSAVNRYLMRKWGFT